MGGWTRGRGEMPLCLRWAAGVGVAAASGGTWFVACRVMAWVPSSEGHRTGGCFRCCDCRTACCRCCRDCQVTGISAVVAVVGLVVELHVLAAFALVAELCFVPEVGEACNGLFAPTDFV